MRHIFTKTHTIFLAVITTFLLFAAEKANATLSNCGGNSLFCNPLTSTDLSVMIENIAKYAVQIGATIAVVMIVMSGYKFVTAGGDVKKLEEAKKMFFGTVIGTAILVGAWVIATAVKTTISSL